MDKDEKKGVKVQIEVGKNAGTLKNKIKKVGTQKQKTKQNRKGWNSTSKWGQNCP